MSTPDIAEIRAELLAEHDTIRRLAREVAGRATCVLRGDAAPGFYAALMRLSSTVEAHIANEEALLRNVIRSIDAWGKVRERMMDEHHAAEHSAVVVGLSLCAAMKDPVSAAQQAELLLDTLLKHMEWEERDLLSPDVLRDDLVTVGSFAG